MTRARDAIAAAQLASEENVIIPNHVKMLKIITKHMHLAQPSQEFVQLIVQYIKHASLYISLRNAKVYDKFPSDFGSPFPVGFARHIEEATIGAQNKFNKMVGASDDDILLDINVPPTESIYTSKSIVHVEPEETESGLELEV